MTLYRVGFTRLVSETRYVFVEDELEELDKQDVVDDGWFKLAEHLKANEIETSGWDDPTVEIVP